MTKRDFFILIIKVFGLFSIVTSLFSVLPSNISFALMDIDAFSVLWIAISIIVVIGLFVLLVFKANKLVSLLNLDQGFDDNRIEFGSLNPTDIIKISAFIIGGVLILDNIPTFLSHLLFAFNGEQVGMEYKTQDKFNWAVSGINIVIGYLLLTNYKFVANKLKKEENK